MKPLSHGTWGPEEEAAILRVVRSGVTTMGPRTQEFEEEFVEFREGDAGNPEGIARVYAWMGKNDEAFLWLDRMVELQGPESVELIRTELYSKLHSDPRWTALQKKYAKPAEDLSHIVFKPAHPPEVAAAIARITSAR